MLTLLLLSPVLLRLLLLLQHETSDQANAEINQVVDYADLLLFQRGRHAAWIACLVQVLPGLV